MANPSKEPSMEDILSSIRDIISEDEEPAAPPKAPAATAAAGRTEPVVLEQSADSGLVPPGGRTPDRGYRPGAGTRLMGEDTEIAGINSFAELDEAIRLGRVGDTLADVVITILRPMLKDWLDENLPDMVEDMVQKEIRRLAEGGRRKRIVEDLGDFPD